MPLLGSVGEVLWDSWAKARFVSSNQKEQDFGKCHGDLIQVAHRGSPWEMGETTYHKGSWEIVLQPYIYL